MTTTLPNNQRFFTVSELMDCGFSYYRISHLVDEGKLIKLNKRVYENTSFVGDESDFAIAAAYAPKGVLCMMTAARFYELTTFLPDAVDVAIERTMKVSTLPDRPSLNLWYFPNTRYELGLTTINDGTGDYRMYDAEKTVVDILYYRNRIGIEETKEILKNYLRRESRNLIHLHRYAEILNCGKILGTYLEVLL